jgi:Glycosyltransferase family 87
VRHTPRLGWLILLAAVGVTLALGAFGVGHGGPSQTNLDMRFLYLAGVFWHRGISAYTPVPPYPVDSWLADAVARYDFAYPPQIAPLCLLLAAWSTAGARLLMTALNVGAAVLLAAVCVRRARDPVPDRVSPAAGASTWLIPAIVIGNFSTAFVIWAGQTTLIATLALMLGWHFARRGRWLLGGVLLAGSTIKPQLGFLVILWLVLERRWRALAATAVTVVALAAVPIGISGPVGVITEWSAAAWRYASGPYNTLGSRMIFGLGNVLYVAGIESSFLLPLALLIVGSLWYYRASLADEDVLALLVGLSLLFGFSHSYDIAALAPLVPAFWRHVHTRTTASLLALALMLVVTLPNSLLESFVSPLLLHVRVVGLFAALSWLVAMSVKGAGSGVGIAPEQGMTPYKV